MAIIGGKFTCLIFEGRIPKHCIGIFNSVEEANAWAMSDSWPAGTWKVIPLYP